MTPLDHDTGRNGLGPAAPAERPTGDPPTGGEERPRPGPRWLGVVEALLLLLACLATALAVGGLELLLLAPQTYELEFPLYGRTVSGGSADPDRLVERIEALGLPASVERRERRGRPTVLLRGLDSVDPAKNEVWMLLEQAGYRRIDPEVRSGPDPQVLLRDYPALTLGSQAAVLIVFGGALSLLRVRPTRSTVARPVALASGVVAGVVGFVAALVVSAFQHLFGWSIEEQTWILELLRDRDGLAVVLPMVVLLMPVSEELLFRGYVFRFLLQRSGVRTAYIVSAASFSAVHLHLPGVPTYFIVGLLFAYVCRRTGTLVAPMTGHVTYNGLALGLTFLVPGGM